MNQPADCIEVCLYKPHPEKSGYLTFDRNLTIGELNDAIQAQLDPRVKRQLEWNGIPPSITLPVVGQPFRKDSALPPFEPPIRTHAELVVQWAPGSNEGYYVSVIARRATEPDLVVWHAKLFDLHATVALHTALVRLLCWGGTGPSTLLLQIEDHLLSQIPQ